MNKGTMVALAGYLLVSATFSFAGSPLIREGLRSIEKVGRTKAKKISLRDGSCADFTGNWAGYCRTKNASGTSSEVPVAHEIKQEGCTTLNIGGRIVEIGESETTTISSDSADIKSISTIEFSAWSEGRKGFFTDFLAAMTPENSYEGSKELVSVKGKEEWKLMDHTLIKNIEIPDYFSAECTLTK